MWSLHSKKWAFGLGPDVRDKIDRMIGCEAATDFGKRCSRSMRYMTTDPVANNKAGGETRIRAACQTYCLDNCSVWASDILLNVPREGTAVLAPGVAAAAAAAEVKEEEEEEEAWPLEFQKAFVRFYAPTHHHSPDNIPRMFEEKANFLLTWLKTSDVWQYRLPLEAVRQKEKNEGAGVPIRGTASMRPDMQEDGGAAFVPLLCGQIRKFGWKKMVLVCEMRLASKRQLTGHELARLRLHQLAELTYDESFAWTSQANWRMNVQGSVSQRTSKQGEITYYYPVKLTTELIFYVSYNYAAPPPEVEVEAEAEAEAEAEEEEEEKDVKEDEDEDEEMAQPKSKKRRRNIVIDDDDEEEEEEEEAKEKEKAPIFEDEDEEDEVYVARPSKRRAQGIEHPETSFLVATTKESNEQGLEQILPTLGKKQLTRLIRKFDLPHKFEKKLSTISKDRVATQMLAAFEEMGGLSKILREARRLAKEAQVEEEEEEEDEEEEKGAEDEEEEEEDEDGDLMLENAVRSLEAPRLRALLARVDEKSSSSTRHETLVELVLKQIDLGILEGDSVYRSLERQEAANAPAIEKQGGGGGRKKSVIVDTQAGAGAGAGDADDFYEDSAPSRARRAFLHQVNRHPRHIYMSLADREKLYARYMDQPAANQSTWLASQLNDIQWSNVYDRFGLRLNNRDLDPGMLTQFRLELAQTPTNGLSFTQDMFDATFNDWLRIPTRQGRRALLAFDVSERKQRQARIKRETREQNRASGQPGARLGAILEARERQAALAQYLAK